MPPGVDPIRQQDGPPEGVYYYRIYAAVLAILSGLGTILGMVMFFAPLLTRSSPRGSAPEMILGLVYGGMGAAFFIPVLLFLSAIKFALVAMYYMHLKNDSRLFSGVFVFPLLIASVVILALIALQAYHWAFARSGG